MTSAWHASDIPDSDLLNQAILQDSAYFRVTSESLALVDKEKGKGWERVHVPDWFERLGTKVGAIIDRVRESSHPEVFFLCAGAAMGLAVSEAIPKDAALLKYLILAGVPNVSLLTAFGTRIAREEVIALRMGLDETGAPRELKGLDKDLYWQMRAERSKALESYPGTKKSLQKRGAVFGEIATDTLYAWIGTTLACAVDAIVKKGGAIVPAVDIAVCLVAAAEAGYFLYLIKENGKSLASREKVEAWKYNYSKEHAELLTEAKKDGKSKKWIRGEIQRRAVEAYKEPER